MADTPTTGNDGGNGGGFPFGMVIGLLAVTAMAGFGYWYFVMNKKSDGSPAPPAVGDNPASNTEKNPVAKEGADTKAHTVESATNVATGKSTPERIAIANAPATGDGVSPIRTDHDKTWNYQKKSGVWYTAKKDGTVLWTSLAKNKKATDTLNAAYPND